MKIQLSSLIHDSIVDGEGIRTVIFTQGCPHNCPGCHNPKTIPFDGGKAIDIDDVVLEIESAGLQKVTFSGGEPFAQAEALYYIASKLKDKGYNIWSYSGFTFEALMRHKDPYKQKLLSKIDILVDGPFLLKDRSIAALFRGSTNQRIIDVPLSLKNGKVILAEAYCDIDDFSYKKEPDIFI